MMMAGEHENLEARWRELNGLGERLESAIDAIERAAYQRGLAARAMIEAGLRGKMRDASRKIRSHAEERPTQGEASILFRIATELWAESERSEEGDVATADCERVRAALAECLQPVVDVQAALWGVFDIRRGKWLGEDDVLYAVRDREKARATAARLSSLENRPHDVRVLR